MLKGDLCKGSKLAGIDQTIAEGGGVDGKGGGDGDVGEVKQNLQNLSKQSMPQLISSIIVFKKSRSVCFISDITHP
jgi:hypothetical protein